MSVPLPKAMREAIAANRKEIKEAKLTRIKVLEPIRKGPYTLWVWGDFPYPLGNVTGLEVTVWNNHNGIAAKIGTRNPMPSLAQFIEDKVSPHWSKIKKAAATAPLNPASGYRRAVEVTSIVLREEDAKAAG